jgi:hypothetical protein
MELFKNIRFKTGMAILSNKLSKIKRKVSYSNIGQVKNIGIAWDASKTEDFAGLSRFYQKMHERNIEVRILGYFPGKELPDQYTAIRYLTCIRKKEINIFYHPVSSEVNSFINTRFDILIDINFRKLLPLKYISTLSNAAFKVGLYESETEELPYDLMMEIKNPVGVDNYLGQIIQYLEMINSGTVNKVK